MRLVATGRYRYTLTRSRRRIKGSRFVIWLVARCQYHGMLSLFLRSPGTHIRPVLAGFGRLYSYPNTCRCQWTARVVVICHGHYSLVNDDTIVHSGSAHLSPLAANGFWAVSPLSTPTPLAHILTLLYFSFCSVWILPYVTFLCAHGGARKSILQTHTRSSPYPIAHRPQQNKAL